MSAHRWPPGLVLVAGLVLAASFQAWEHRRWKTPVVGWEVALVLLTVALVGLLLWRLASAALAAWAGMAPGAARRLVALAHLPLLLTAAATSPRRVGLAVVSAFLFVAAHAWLAWRHRPAGLSADALAARGGSALAAAAEAARGLFGALVLALVLADLRLLHLAADPPVDLGPSGGAWTDPGEWAHNARNRILYGEWVWDEVNFMYVSPVTNVCFYLVFRLLGVGYAQVGLVSVLFSLATLLLFYLSLREVLGRGGALLATALLGGSYLFVMYNRIGLVETPAVFFQVLTLYFAQRGVREPRYFALAGAASLVPLAVKMQMTYIFPAAVFAVALHAVRWTEPGSGERSWRPVAYFLAGAAITLAALATVWLVPYRAEILWRLQNEWRLHALPMTLPRLLRNVFYNPFVVYFLGSPVLLLLGGLVFCQVVLRLLRRAGPVPFPQLLAVWWIAGGFGYLAISQYRPLRYYVSLIPPMVILATTAVVGLWRARPVAVPAPGPLAVWVYGGAAFLAGLTAVGYAYARMPLVQNALAYLSLYPLTEKDLALATGALALAGSAVGFRLLAPCAARMAARVPGWAPRALAVLLVLAFAVIEGWSYFDWKLHRAYKLVSISRELGQRLPPGSVIAGIFAPILTLENRHRSLAIWDRYGNWQGDPLARFGVTHVAVMAYIDEIGYYQRRFPEAMSRARLLDEWILWRTRVSFYELPRR